MADTGLFGTIYNPDVLTCLANLSNDEVFTPPEIANQMLDLLPQELFCNPDTTFLDPACKSGVFLREIAKRLLVGLEQQIPDLQERIDHIFHKQLFGIAITELTSLISRRSVYCSKYPNSNYSVSKFENAEGNIRYKLIQHTWQDGKCIYCGASEGTLGGNRRETELETHAYEFIHLTKLGDLRSMKFDVIISNPPYQTYTNLQERIAAKQAKPLFHTFVSQAKKLRPKYISMVIPARWYSGGIGLSDFRETMVHDRHITKLVDYPNSKDCFNGVDIAGGVCYFLWDRDKEAVCEVTNIIGNVSSSCVRALDEYGDILIRSNASISIINKVRASGYGMLDNQVFSLDPFGIPTSARGFENYFSGSLRLIHSKGVGYIKYSEVQKNSHLIDKWKVIIARIVPGNGEVGVDPEKGYRATTKPRTLKPGEVNTFSYMLLGAFDTEEEAENFKAYLMCKFPRFLLRLTYSSMNIAKSNFMFVPQMDFTQKWTDKALYEKFGLSMDEIGLVEKTIRLFDDNGGEN